MSRENEDPTAGGEIPELEDLARRCVDLWQDHVAAMAGDPELVELLTRLAGMMTPGAIAGAGLAGGWPGPGGSSPGENEKGRADGVRESQNDESGRDSPSAADRVMAEAAALMEKNRQAMETVFRDTLFRGVAGASSSRGAGAEAPSPGADENVQEEQPAASSAKPAGHCGRGDDSDDFDRNAPTGTMTSAGNSDKSEAGTEKDVPLRDATGAGETSVPHGAGRVSGTGQRLQPGAKAPEKAQPRTDRTDKDGGGPTADSNDLGTEQPWLAASEQSGAAGRGGVLNHGRHTVPLSRDGRVGQGTARAGGDPDAFGRPVGIASGAASPADVSGECGDDLEQLRRRLALLEKRLADLEAGEES